MSDPTDPSSVEALLKERDALRGWLDRLDRSEAAVPESVRAKVRHDYQARLDGMLDRLRQHADVVATRLLEDQADRDRLSDQARGAREALAEAELRHAVGEYDAARFDAERVRYLSELEQYEAALNAVTERISDLEDVHYTVMREPTGAAESAPVFSERAIDFMVEHVTVEEIVVAEVAIEELAPADEPPSDADDLLSIFDQADASDPEPPQYHASSSDDDRLEPPPASRTPGFGPLSFTPKGGAPDLGGPARPAVPSLTPPIGMPGLDQSPRFVRPAHERGSELVELPAERGERFRVIPDPEPVLPEAPAAEAPEANARTLRCGECGAMNRPLEWYCEKCGAELTAV